MSTFTPWQSDIRTLLSARGYPSYAALHIAEHVAIYGVADVGPAMLDPDDRPDVEAIVAGERPRWCGRSDCEAFADDDPYSYLAKRWESDLAHYLYSREYSSDAVAHVVRHAHEDGSVDGCSMPPHERNALKSAVRVVVEELLTEGVEPTGWQLRRRLPMHGPFTLVELRDELADAGLIDWELPDERETGYLPDSREIRIRAFRVRYGLPLPEEVRP